MLELKPSRKITKLDWLAVAASLITNKRTWEHTTTLLRVLKSHCSLTLLKVRWQNAEEFEGEKPCELVGVNCFRSAVGVLYFQLGIFWIYTTAITTNNFSRFFRPWNCYHFSIWLWDAANALYVRISSTPKTQAQLISSYSVSSFLSCSCF